ncbi:expressed unknown protein [Seminavis robusta]|uniref:Uncharacterized protein n=1 Tax=Seminavis robusta TaxID=568900 RepID=A0A9N8HKW9_9STRA|nr:expressed unknown protein [Seminavis robusta]|eukprot:Sro765_g199200.1 n/a (793) ;mRNA; f:25056-27749
MMKAMHRSGGDGEGSPSGKSGKGLFKRWKRGSGKSTREANSSEAGNEDSEANNDRSEFLADSVTSDPLMDESSSSLPDGQNWMRSTSLQLSVADSQQGLDSSTQDMYQSQPALETFPEDLETPVPDPKKTIQDLASCSSEEVSPVCVDQFPVVHIRPDSSGDGTSSDDEEEESGRRASVSTYFDASVNVMPLPFTGGLDEIGDAPENTRFLNLYRDETPPEHGVQTGQQQAAHRRPTAFERAQSRSQVAAKQPAAPAKGQLITAEVTVVKEKKTDAQQDPQESPIVTTTKPRVYDKKSKHYNRYGIAGLLDKHKVRHTRRASETAAAKAKATSSPEKQRRNTLAVAVQQGIINQITGVGRVAKKDKHNQSSSSSPETSSKADSSSSSEHPSSSSSDGDFKATAATNTDAVCKEDAQEQGRSASTRNIAMDNTVDNDAMPTRPARRTQSESSEETVQTCPSRTSTQYSYIKGLPFTKDPATSSQQQQPYSREPEHGHQGHLEAWNPAYSREPEHGHQGHLEAWNPANNSHQGYPRGDPRRDPKQRVMPTPSTVSMASEETEITAPGRIYAFRLHEEAIKSRMTVSPPQSDFSGAVSTLDNNSSPILQGVSYGIPADNNPLNHQGPVVPPVATCRLPDSMPPRRHRSHRAATKAPQQQPPGPDETIFIHVKPNLRVPLRRVPDVLQALAQHYYDTPNCPCCNKQVAVVADAAFLHCPICNEISPLFGNIWPVGNFPEEPEYHRLGLGLGMTWETMKKVYQEMFPEEYNAADAAVAEKGEAAPTTTTTPVVDSSS